MLSDDKAAIDEWLKIMIYLFIYEVVLPHQLASYINTVTKILGTVLYLICNNK